MCLVFLAYENDRLNKFLCFPCRSRIGEYS
jgi:hypothetical protein